MREVVYIFMFLIAVYLTVPDRLWSLNVRERFHYEPLLVPDCNPEAVLDRLMSLVIGPVTVKTFLVPVTIYFEDSSRQRISKSVLGFGGFRGLSRIKLDLRYGMDEVSMIKRLQSIDRRSIKKCTVWVEGFWGDPAEEYSVQSLHEVPLNERLKRQWVFTVMSIYGECPVERTGNSVDIIYIRKSL